MELGPHENANPTQSPPLPPTFIKPFNLAFEIQIPTPKFQPNIVFLFSNPKPTQNTQTKRALSEYRGGYGCS